MKVLILEDNKERVDWFIEQSKEEVGLENIHVTETVEEAKKFIAEHTYEAMLLDHDLGGEIYVDIEKDNTGTQLVRYIIANNLQKDAIIIVHSHNPASFLSMYKPLKDAGYKTMYRPFSMLKEWMKNDNKNCV